MRSVSIAIIAALLIGPIGRARATDTWTDPDTGIRHLHRTTTTPWNIHALVVDLCAPGIKIRATAPPEKGKTVSAFGKLVGAQAVVNADFFSFANFQPSGIDVGNGQAWSRNNDPSLKEPMVAFGPSRADVLPPTNVVTGSPPPWATEVVSSRPPVLNAGVVVTQFVCGTGENNCARDPRTGMGLSQDRRKLVLAVVDGRQPSLSAGMTQQELGALLLELGAWDGISMDSGGSSEMWLATGGVLNSPSDGQERVVANHLAVLASGSGVSGSCTPPPSDMGSPLDSSADLAATGGLPEAGSPGGAPDGHTTWTDPNNNHGCAYSATAAASASVESVIILLLALLIGIRRTKASSRSIDA